MYIYYCMSMCVYILLYVHVYVSMCMCYVYCCMHKYVCVLCISTHVYVFLYVNVVGGMDLCASPCRVQRLLQDSSHTFFNFETGCLFEPEVKLMGLTRDTHLLLRTGIAEACCLRGKCFPHQTLSSA